MTIHRKEEITNLLFRLRSGDREAESRLLSAVYDELHRIASRYMRQERSQHTLQTTALVNEAYLRLVDQRRVDWKNRAHFFGVAAQLMRRILVDHARHRSRGKRGGGLEPLILDEALAFSPERATEVVELDEALSRLTENDPRAGRVVELRFFGGLTIEETAEVLRVSPRTVKREWRFARAWLRTQLEASGRHAG